MPAITLKEKYPRPYAAGLFVAWCAVVGVWAACAALPWQHLWYGSAEQQLSSGSAELDPARAKPTAKPRDNRLDEAKFLLMTLVIFQHSLNATERTKRKEDEIYDKIIAMVSFFIRSFHMPAFVFISGFCSKKYIAEHQPILRLSGLWRTVVDLLGGYIVVGLVEGTVETTARWADGGQTSWYVIIQQIAFDRSGGPWYLIALFGWRTVWCPVSRVLHPQARFAVAVLAATACQAWMADTTVSYWLTKCVHFLPFFALGMDVSMENLERCRSGWVLSLGVVAMVVLASLWKEHWQKHWPWIYFTVKLQGTWKLLGYLVISGVVLAVMGIALRLADVGASSAHGAAIHAQMASFGTGTLYAYVLHVIVLNCFVHFMDVRPAVDGIPEALRPLVLLGFAVALNMTFASQFSRRAFSWMVQPAWLFPPSPPEKE